MFEKEKYVENPGVDFTRNRKLPMRDVITLLLSMSGGSLKKELHQYATISGVDVTASAFVQQRNKITPRAFEKVFRRFGELSVDCKKFRNYRLFAVDGSCINKSRNPEEPSFVQNDSNLRGFNQVHLNAVFIDALLQYQPKVDEIGGMITMLKWLHFGANVEREQKRNPNKKYARWDFPSPYPMSFRVVRVLLPSGEYETLATSLPESFTIEDIKEIYRKRWCEEISFKFIKYCQNLVFLHGKSDKFVKQEIWVALTMYNFSSRIAGAVVVQKKESNIYAYKVNFMMASYLCKEYYRRPQQDGNLLMQAINRYTEPIREGRKDARKLRPKGFVGFVYRIAA